MAPFADKLNPFCLVSSSSEHRDHRHHRHRDHSQDGGPSRQRRSALAIVAAFNNNIDTQTIASFRGDGFVREVLPRSLGQPSQDAAAFQRSLNMYRAVFRHYALDLHEVVDDPISRKVCLWLTAHADTVGGAYVCDMVWALSFDDSGERVVAWKEFLDAGAQTMEFELLSYSCNGLHRTDFGISRFGDEQEEDRVCRTR